MLKKFFSIEHDNRHTTLNLLGLKLKFVNTKQMSNSLRKLQLQADRNLIPTIYNTELTLEQKEWFLSNKFYKEVGYFPNLRNPKSFNEKINWMKLHYYNKEEKNIIDKCEFKNYIKNKLGEEYVIPLIKVYDSVYDINFDELPQKFVIKTTTGGSGEAVEIVKDKDKVDVDRIKFKFNNLVQDWHSIYYYCLSRGYKDIKPRIIVEEYMPIREGKALEYKMFCFNGVMKFCLVECDFFGKKPKRAYYDKDFKEMPFSIGKYPKQKLMSHLKNMKR